MSSLMFPRTAPDLLELVAMALDLPTTESVYNTLTDTPPSFVLADLSSSSLAWLEHASMTNQNFEARRINNIVLLNSERDSGLKLFTVFPKLPTELQDKIWEWYALMEPRFVDIAMGMGDENFTGWGKNNDIVLRQINQQKRAETLSIHGYVMLKHFGRETTWLYNPNIDVLLLNEPNLRRNGLNPNTVSQTLEQGGVRDKVRIVVLEAIKPRFNLWMSTFRSYSNLEVVFVVVGQTHISMGYEDECERTHEFNAFGRSCAMLFRYELLCNAPDLKQEFGEHWNPLDALCEAFYAKLARGPERIVPHVVFVRKVWVHFPTMPVSWGR